MQDRGFDLQGKISDYCRNIRHTEKGVSLRVTLVYPRFGEHHHSMYFPFGLAYVAASLQNAGHTVTVVDMEGNSLSPDTAVKLVVKSEPEMVAFGGMVTRFRYVKELALRIRKEIPGVFMCAGNSGASTVPGLYLKSCKLDCVVLGEGDNITNTQMYGTGFYGFETYNSILTRCSNSEIWDCTGGAFHIFGCDTAKIYNCNIHDNTSRSDFSSFGGCYFAEINNCIWSNNNIDDSAVENQALFRLWNNTNLFVRNSKFINNHVESLIHREANDIYTSENIDMNNNTIDEEFESIDEKE